MKRYVFYLHSIPDDPKQVPQAAPVFFCRSEATVKEILKYLEEVSSAPEDVNPRRSRQIAVVSIDDKVFNQIPEGRRPETSAGDVFPSIKHAAQALGVSRTYIHRKLAEGSTTDTVFPSARIKGVTIAFLEDLPV